MDGLASALIARKRYPSAKMISVQYGEEQKEIGDIKNSRIILVDFSYNNLIMQGFKNEAKEFIWIDHHKTAKEELSDLWNDLGIAGIRSTKSSACELTWHYFNPNKDYPYGIELIGDRDTWTFKYKEDTKYFNEYLRLYDIDSKNDINFIEDDIFSEADNINACIDDGASFYDYMISEIKRIYKKGHLQGRKFICYSNSYISELANYALKQDECDIAEIRQRVYDKDKGWQTVVSLRSKNDVDVSKIAKEHGGGGHFHAAGYIQE